MLSQPRTSTLFVVVLSALITFAAVSSASEQEDKRPVAAKDTGMLGLTPGRIARLDVVNLGARKSGGIRLEFFDASGKVLAEDTVMLEPGQSRKLDFMFDTGGRMEIRAHATIFDS